MVRRCDVLVDHYYSPWLLAWANSRPVIPSAYKSAARSFDVRTSTDGARSPSGAKHGVATNNALDQGNV
jgi:hypothetical protein